MLRDHPGVGVPLPKELRFFAHRYLGTGRNTSTIQRAMQIAPKGGYKSVKMERLVNELRIALGNDEGYLRVFGHYPEPVVGEISPRYCMLPYQGLRHLSRISPNARFILLILDPVERASSAGKMKAKEKFSSLTEDSVADHSKKTFQLNMSRFSEIIDRFTALGENRFFVEFLDEIRSDPLALLESICSFLEIEFAEDHFPNATQEKNKGESSIASDKLCLELFYKPRDEYDRLELLYPEKVGIWRKIYERIDLNKSSETETSTNPNLKSLDVPV